jgi:hypothetical protein
MGPHGFNGPGGFHTLPDGERIEWRFKKAGSKIGTVTIRDQDYDPALGSLFVVATKGAEPRVLQLKRDLTRMKQEEIVGADVVGVIRGVEEIGSFFAGAANPR